MYLSEAQFAQECLLAYLLVVYRSRHDCWWRRPSGAQRSIIGSAGAVLLLSIARVRTAARMHGEHVAWGTRDRSGPRSIRSQGRAGSELRRLRSGR